MSMEEGRSGEDLDGGGGGRRGCGMDPTVVEAAWHRGGGVDPMAVEGARCEAHTEEELVHGMNPAVVGEVVGDSSTWTRWLSGRRPVRTRRLWRCGGSRGAGGHSEMKKKSSARV
jgi:hypothetical protein